MMGGAEGDLLIVQYLSLYLTNSTRAWIEHLPAGCIDSWNDLRHVFIGYFQGNYVRPRNSWDLRNSRQRPGETLCEYICHFFKAMQRPP